MTINLELTEHGLKITDYDILPDNIKDSITKIMNYRKYALFNKTIITCWEEETMDVIYILNEHFDIFIKKGFN